MAALLLGHVELLTQAGAFGCRGLEEQDGKLPDAAPLTADERRRVQADLLRGVTLCTCNGRQPIREDAQLVVKHSVGGRMFDTFSLQLNVLDGKLKTHRTQQEVTSRSRRGERVREGKNTYDYGLCHRPS